MQTTNEVDYSRGLHGGKSWVRKHPATPPGVNIKAYMKLERRKKTGYKDWQTKPGSLNRRNH
jgi:hypothetical protein